MNNERKSKNIVIGLLCAIILFMGIGFAALYSEIKIEGSTTISNTWNVQITNIEVVSTSGNANAGAQSFTGTTANFNATLMEPGDSITYKVTVKNKGSIDAVLAVIADNTVRNEADSIEYTLSSENPKVDDKLASDEVHTFVVVASYKETAVGENAPTESTKTKDFSLQLKYEQDLTSN